MSRDERINMPSSGAGITRYFDEERSKVRFKPGHVILMAAIVFLLVMFLQVYGRKMFGF